VRGCTKCFNFVSGMQNAIHKTDLKFLDFVPANVRSMQMEERMIRVADNRGILRNALRSVAGEYDYVILDCPPFLRGLSTNAIIASDSVLIPSSRATSRSRPSTVFSNTLSG
jgi:chromosome partitioning protein